MSDRRKKAENTRKVVAYAAAIIVHAVIIGALVFNFTSKPKLVEAFDADKIDVVKATTIDESQIKKQQDKIKQKDRAKKRREQKERERLKKLKRDAEREKQKIADLKKQRKEEQLQAQKRKEIALKKQQEEAKRLKEKKAREKKLADKKKKELDEKKRLEELARIEKEKEAVAAQESLNKLLEQEEAANNARLAQERTATVMSRYSSLIREAVNQKRTIAPDFERWRVVKMNIKLSPRGEVLDVSIVKSSGSDRYDRDAETAIRQASPLPIPSPEEDEEAHRVFRDVTLNFSMPGAG